MFANIKKLINSHSASPNHAAVDLKKQGDVYIGEERYEQAIACYQQAIKLSPHFSEALVALGFALLETGVVEQAEKCLQQALSITPNSVDAYFMLGNIAKSKGDLRQATEHYIRASNINPQFEFAYSMLFEVYQAQGNTALAKSLLERAILAFPSAVNFIFERAGLAFAEKDYQKAITLLEKVLSLEPEHIASHSNLAKIYMQLERNEEAIAHLKKLISINPNNAALHEDLANAYLKLERKQDALNVFEEAIKTIPNVAAIHGNLGNLYLELGRKQDALNAFKEVVRIDPESPLKHLVAAFSGLTTTTAPTSYVEQLFDQYAEKFESHLTQTLHYHIPTLLVSLIDSEVNLAGRKLDVLDLGCGTGLFGKAISSHASRIVGVDISTKMLEKAAELNIYDLLEHKDILSMMRSEPDASYDLIAATDVFVYLGALDELVLEAKRLLRPHGIFAFSTESLSESEMQNFKLNDTGRYTHAISYLNKLANDVDFNILETKEEIIRINHGKPVIGYLSLWLVDAE